MTSTAKISQRGSAPLLARRVRPCRAGEPTRGSAAGRSRTTDGFTYISSLSSCGNPIRRSKPCVARKMPRVMRDRQTTKICAVGRFPGPAVDPISPSGRLSSLESATSCPEEAIIFRKAANTVRVMCEARLQQATAMAALGLAASLSEAGVQGVEAKSGFAVTKTADGRTLATVAHMWIEVGGRVVDVCYNTTYVFEDARRAGLDLSDEQLVRSRVGSRMSPLLEGILSSRSRLRLTVLDQEINVGPEAWAAGDGGSCAVTELATEAPADGEGLDEAKSMRRAFKDLIHNEEVNQFWLEGMPPEYRCIYADLGGPRTSSM